MPDTQDRALLERFVSGDADAFEALFRQFSVEVHRWVMRIVRDPSAADDVVVETFWRAYRSRARFDPARSFGAWLRRVATNAALDELRSARKRSRWRPVDERITAGEGREVDTAEQIMRAFR